MSKFNLKKIFAKQDKELRIRMGNNTSRKVPTSKYWDKEGKLKKYHYDGVWKTKKGNHYVVCFQISNDNGYEGMPILMSDTEFLKLLRMLYRTDGDEEGFSIMIYNLFTVADNITPRQLKNFRLDKSKWVYNEIVYGYRPNIWGYGDKLSGWDTEQLLKEREWYKDFKEQLEYAKYNPRHPLGKLEFDRRAEEDGIKFADEVEEDEDEEHRKHLIECIMKSKDAGTEDDFTDKEKFPIHLLEEIQREVFKEYAEDNLLPWGQQRHIAIQAFYKEHFNDE